MRSKPAPVNSLTSPSACGPHPSYRRDILDAYRPKAEAVARIHHRRPSEPPHADHAPFFDAFRKAVLALDPCVSEEFLKLYVAYKAETNFVDVVPLSQATSPLAQHALC